jgi:O-antigen ligase
MTPPRSLPALTSIGRALFLAGIFLMVTGDWPEYTLLSTRWVMPLPVLGWPWLYLALLTAAFVLLVSSGKLWVTRPTAASVLHRPLALLTTAFLISVACSQVPSLSWFAFGCFVGIVGFSLMAARIVEDEPGLAGTSIVLAIAASFLAVRVILWRFDEGLAMSAFHIRNNAWLGKIQLAWVFNLVAPFLLARFLGERRIVAAVSYGTAWVLSGAATYVVFSKAGSFAFVLTTLTLCVLNPRSWRRSLTLLAGVMGVTVGLIAVSPTMSSYVLARIIRPDRDAGIGMRLDVWRDAVRMIADHPLTGIGLGTYDDVAYSQYGPLQEYRHFFRNGWHAHNMFLHVLAETGAVGFLAWCYLWFAIVRVQLRRWRAGPDPDRLNSTALLCALTAFFILSLTEAMIAARVYASLRMNLTLGLLVMYGLRRASAPEAPSFRSQDGRRLG